MTASKTPGGTTRSGSGEHGRVGGGGAELSVTLVQQLKLCALSTISGYDFCFCSVFGELTGKKKIRLLSTCNILFFSESHVNMCDMYRFGSTVSSSVGASQSQNTVFLCQL